MLYGQKSKDELNHHLEKVIINSDIIKQRKSRRKFYDNLENHFHMETDVANDIVTFRRDIAEFSPFELFCVMWFLDRDNLPKFFTEKEIAAFSQDKFERNVATFPVTFSNMVQVADDQWIGRITVQEIMALKRARFLNYDENEQRALRRVKRGEVEIFKPYINQKSVREIRDAMLNGTYIPDPITLNMGEGADYTFVANKLVVNSIPNGMFNLDDGYHRYLAMSMICDFDKNFDYPMELRVVAFSNTKANSFIFQQDQKTQMKKMVSQSYDAASIPNKVCAKLNSESTSNLQGMIGRNNSKIDMSVLGRIITYFYRKRVKRSEETAYMLEIKNNLERKFNALTEQDQKYLGKYTDEMLLTVMYVFSDDNIPQSEYANVVNSILNSLTPEESKLLQVSKAGTIKKRGVDLLKNKLKEVGYV